MNRKHVISALVVGAAACSMAIAAVVFWPGGVAVVVKNVDDRTIQNVTVHVSGNSYPIGDLTAAKQIRIPVRPNGESHVEISFLGMDGSEKRHVADCYFEPAHYHGTIEIDVSDDGIVRCKDDIRYGFY